MLPMLRRSCPRCFESLLAGARQPCRRCAELAELEAWFALPAREPS